MLYVRIYAVRLRFKAREISKTMLSAKSDTLFDCTAIRITDNPTQMCPPVRIRSTSQSEKQIRTPRRRKSVRGSYLYNLLVVEGFEPSNDGVRVRCLTAWRHHSQEPLINNLTIIYSSLLSRENYTAQRLPPKHCRASANIAKFSVIGINKLAFMIFTTGICANVNIPRAFCLFG